jgi:hypothetical protein
MPIHEIRETLNSGNSTLVGQDGYIMFQKRIELMPGMRHTINHADFFDDGNLFASVTASSANFVFEFYVTNYPILLGNVNLPAINQTNMGPQAGDDQVLFKVRKYTAGQFQTEVEFPNAFLGSSPTFSFYTPQLYLTAIIANDSAEAPEENVFFSWYGALESKEVDAVEYGIGLLREYNANQMRRLTSNGVLITEAEVIGGYPLWQMGGIRPELMTGTTTTIADGNWFLNQAYAATGGEVMEGSATIRTQLNEARTMVAHDAAFGSELLEFPDWFKAIAKPFAGLTGGPLRANFPPLQKNDNGNTEMN